MSFIFSFVLLLDSFASGLSHEARALLLLFVVKDADRLVSGEAEKEVLEFEEMGNDENVKAKALLLFVVNDADRLVSGEAEKEVLEFEEMGNDENGDGCGGSAYADGRLIAYGI
jgi:hypothetical protein